MVHKPYMQVQGSHLCVFAPADNEPLVFPAKARADHKALLHLHRRTSKKKKNSNTKG